MKPEMWCGLYSATGKLAWIRSLKEPVPKDGVSITHHDLLQKVGSVHNSLFGSTEDTPPAVLCLHALECFAGRNSQNEPAHEAAIASLQHHNMIKIVNSYVCCLVRHTIPKC